VKASAAFTEFLLATRNVYNYSTGCNFMTHNTRYLPLLSSKTNNELKYFHRNWKAVYIAIDTILHNVGPAYTLLS